MEEPIYYKKPHRFSDERGFFQEIYNGARLRESADDHGSIPAAMVQINHSRSEKGVLRGLHWQKPNPVGKYVTCIRGRILDIVVDIRRSSPAFKQWQGYEIEADTGQALWVPEGFAHGFLVISPVADVLYAQSAPFDPEGDRVLRWNDPELGIRWPLMTKEYIVSEKDATAPMLSELPEEAFFD